jgi:glutathione synthase/RimK-type ligase-like ATP-grasp enzyme
MTDISILYDRSESDEMGIKLVAEEMGLDLGYIPFHKVAIGFGRKGFSYKSIGKDYTEELKETKVVLNRGQSKNRRIYAAMVLEGIGKEVVNPLFVESVCASKVRSLLAFWKAGLKVPVTSFTPSNVKELKPGGGEVDNSLDIVKLIHTQLNSQIVLKPDGGTHGRGIILANNNIELVDALKDIKPSIINPSGVLAQELIPKWFYDLRIIVSKEKGRPFNCASTAMVRGGFKDFRTNTYLGNMVFRVNLPLVVMVNAVRAGQAIAQDCSATVIALDAMPFFDDPSKYDEKKLKALFVELEEPFNQVLKAKTKPNKRTDFKAYSIEVEKAYSEYMSTEPYLRIKEIIQESLNDCANEVVLHEGNSCPEFWEQTRIVGGVDVGGKLLQVAKSLLN